MTKQNKILFIGDKSVGRILKTNWNIKNWSFVKRAIQKLSKTFPKSEQLAFHEFFTLEGVEYEPPHPPSDHDDEIEEEVCSQTKNAGASANKVDAVVVEAMVGVEEADIDAPNSEAGVEPPEANDDSLGLRASNHYFDFKNAAKYDRRSDDGVGESCLMMRNALR